MSQRYIGKCVNITLPVEMIFALRERAREDRTSMAFIIRHSVEVFLASKERIAQISNKYCLRCRHKILSGADFDSHEEVCKILHNV